MKWFQIKDHLECPNRWFLGTPLEPTGKSINPNLLLDAQHLNFAESILIPKRRTGTPLDFTFADCDMPVVRGWIAEILCELCPKEVQLLPAKVNGESEIYHLLNVLETSDCLDYGRSLYDLWTDRNPEKAGQLFCVHQLIVKGNALTGRSICRVKDWEIVIIISEQLKNRLELRDIRGVFFQEV